MRIAGGYGPANGCTLGSQIASWRSVEGLFAQPKPGIPGGREQAPQGFPIFSIG